MLSLPQIEQRHSRRLLVLRRVALQDLIDEALVLFGKFEWDRGIVLWGVAMLSSPSAATPFPNLLNIKGRTYHCQSIRPPNAAFRESASQRQFPGSRSDKLSMSSNKEKTGREPQRHGMAWVD
jgi:hypothetical protein